MTVLGNTIGTRISNQKCQRGSSGRNINKNISSSV